MSDEYPGTNPTDSDRSASDLAEAQTPEQAPEESDVYVEKTPTRPIQPVKLTAAQRREEELSSAFYRALKRRDDERQFEEERMAAEAAAFALADEEDEVIDVDAAAIEYESRPHWMQASTFWAAIAMFPFAFILVLLAYFIVLRQLFLAAENDMFRLDLTFAGLAVIAGIAAVFWKAMVDRRYHQENGIETDGAIEGLVKWSRERRIVTNQGVRRRFKAKGWFWNMAGSFKDFDARVPHTKITNVDYTQDWLGKLFNYGTVLIDSYGQDDHYFTAIPYVRKPSELKDLVYSHITKTSP